MEYQPGISLLPSLKQMIQLCRDIQTLLDSDITDFSQYAVKNIDASNQQKMFLLEKLAMLVNEMNAIPSPQSSNANGLLEKIEKHTESLESNLKREVETVIIELKTEIAKAYQSLAINSKIVFANMEYLKSIWDKLIAHQSEVEFVYDGKGNATK